MTPLWIFLLGRFYTEDNPRITIPVVNVFTSLAVVLIPVGLGMLLNHFSPKWGARLAWALRPFTGLVGVVFISLGIVTYMYALKRATWQLIVGCLLLPLGGYSIGFLVGKLIVKDTKKATTISLETGFQNMALAVLMLSASLPSPESDLAGVIPILYAFLNSVFPTIAFLGLIIHRYATTGQLTSHEENFDLTHENALDNKITNQISPGYGTTNDTIDQYSYQSTTIKDQCPNGNTC